MLEFILARYNYWIVIILMMTGLYIVFSRGNLVKTIIGLNIFQTSVFIFYITVGKVVGGTAPILVGGHGDAAHGSDHDAGHGAEHGTDHHDGGDAGEYDGHNEVHDAPAGSAESHAAASHEELHASPLSSEDAEAFVNGDAANDLDQAGADSVVPTGTDLHSLPGDEVPSNELFGTNSAVQHDPAANSAVEHGAGDGAGIAIQSGHAQSGGHGADVAAAMDAQGAIDGVLYSNPLPHVLILTAIVVGVATTAVGLALAIRIREAYGTIEEDALEKMNNEAEFGGHGEPVEAAQ